MLGTEGWVDTKCSNTCNKREIAVIMIARVMGRQVQRAMRSHFWLGDTGSFLEKGVFQ